MKVAKIIELVGTSELSFDDAIKNAIKKASKTLRGISGVRILNENIKIRDNKITEYRVNMKLAFGVEDGAKK